MSEQLKVTITNLTDRELTLKWLAKGALCVSAGSSVTVDYEPWSCIDNIRRRDMQSYVESGSIALCMHLMAVDGTQYDINYNPFSTGKGVVCSETAQVALNRTVVKNLGSKVVESDTSSHIVTTGSSNASSMGFRSAAVTPPTQQKHAEARVGFNIDSKPGVSGTMIPANNAAYLTEKKLEKTAERDYRSEFNELVKQKKWNEALELLIEEFGKDKVTFSSRTIMTLKDYDEIVSRKILA